MSALHPREDLAAYALGALDAPERRSVAAHLAGCLSCTAEESAYAETLWAVAEAAASRPPAALRDRIVRRVQRPAPLAGLLAWIARPLPAAIPLALAIALVVSLASLAGVRRDADAYAEALNGVAGARVVALAAAADAPSGARGSLVVPRQGEAFLLVELPAPPAGKAWEAWVIKGERALPAGLATAGGMVSLRLTTALAPGDTVAVTLETASGAPAPTTRPVLTGKS